MDSDFGLQASNEITSGRDTTSEAVASCDTTTLELGAVSVDTSVCPFVTQLMLRFRFTGIDIDDGRRTVAVVAGSTITLWYR